VNCSDGGRRGDFRGELVAVLASGGGAELLRTCEEVYEVVVVVTVPSLKPRT
jgi:hypothetical protein